MSRRLGIAVALVGMVVVPGTVAAFTCSGVAQTGCPVPGATCFVACAEDDVRAALDAMNRCAAPDVTLRMGPDAATTCGATPIPLRMDPTAPATARGSCGDDHGDRWNALCLAGTGTVFDGRGAILQYAGAHICASCDGECSLCPGEQCASRQPALFVVRGSRNTVRDLEMRFFPEGIHLRAGDGHTIERVTSRAVCEEAITVDAGSGQRVSEATLVGNTEAADGGACWTRLENTACATDADCRAGARCYCGDLARLGDCAAPPAPPLWPAATPGQCHVPSRCGRDKAIQVNSGQATIARNRIDTFSQPVSVLGGAHVIADNVTCGDPKERNVCQAYGVRGGAVTFRGNRIDHCKFGLRLDGPAQVDAVGNVITNGWVSAFQLKGQGDTRLRAEGNLLRDNGWSTESDCQRGSLVVTGNALARVDFGGGDAAGAAVLGTPSAGGNVSCQSDAATPHVWNGTPCDGAGVDAGASIGLGGDAFFPHIVLPPDAGANVVDGAPLETRMTAATTYDACASIVVEECECPGGQCAPAGGALRVLRAVVRVGGGGAAVVVRGLLYGEPPANGLTLEMPGVLADAVAWAADDCRRAPSGRTTCAVPGGAAQVRFSPRGADVHLFRVSLGEPVLAARSREDVSVVLAWDGTQRAGSLPASDCRSRELGLRCRGR
jgi:hypothetical protein